MIAGGAVGIDVEESDDKIVVILNRPESRNAVTLAMIERLHEVCGQAERRPKPLIITGADGIFAAGADIEELRRRDRYDALAGINSGLFARIARLPMPTIAAVGGAAIGGGAELAYACDFRVGTPQTTFANPEGRLGIHAAAGAAWRLPELVGEAVAKEIMLAGRVLTADEAFAVRLLNEIVEPDELLDAAQRWVERIMRNAPLAVRLTKLALRSPRDAHPLVDDLAQAVLFETEDKQQRMDAFLARRRDS